MSAVFENKAERQADFWCDAAGTDDFGPRNHSRDVKNIEIPPHASRPSAARHQPRKVWLLSNRLGDKRFNVHGALDLETGKTRAMIDVESVDAISTITLPKRSKR
jgi:hypothetical protein